MKSEISAPLFNLAKKFSLDLKPAQEAYHLNPIKEAAFREIVQSLSEWIQSHRDVLLLAWFAQYGFEPGKAVLVERRDGFETVLYIREATADERVPHVQG